MSEPVRAGFVALLLLTCLTVTCSLAGCASNDVPTPGCSRSMTTAAAFTDISDDSRLLRTLTACDNFDDWLAAIKKHTGPGTITVYKREDARVLLEVLCSERHGGGVCNDAIGRGEIEG